MILAHGSFDPIEILNGAIEMSEGRTACHNNPIRCHRDGWGVLLHHPREKKAWSIYRSTSPLSESEINTQIIEKPCDLMIVHARHATLSKNIGINFSHPLFRAGTPDWYFFHNGYLPTVYRKLGMQESNFDSREYFDYLVGKDDHSLENISVIDRLEAIEAGGTAGNAFAVSTNQAYAICWFPRDSKFPDFYTMWSRESETATVISSEIVPVSGFNRNWQPMTRGAIVELQLNKTSKLGEQRDD